MIECPHCGKPLNIVAGEEDDDLDAFEQMGDEEQKKKIKKQMEEKE